jgi:hemoglobin/transferrin/lactoferrin receptor protein
LSDQFDVGSFSNATRDFVNAGLVQRIEVLHGPASALYGSSAIGGVVAVQTPDPQDLLAGSAHGGDLLATWRGADSSFHGTGLLALGNESAGLLAGVSLRDGSEAEAAAADASLDRRDFRRRSALLKFVTDTAGGRRWRLSYLHQDAEVDSDSNSMLGSGRYRSTTALEGEDAYKMDLISAAYEFGAPDALIDAGSMRVYYEHAKVEQSTLDERALARSPVSIQRYFEFDQDIAGAEFNLQKTIEGNRLDHRVGFGVEYRTRRTEEYRDGLSTSLSDGTQSREILGEVFPLRDFPISDTTEWGAYIEDSMSVGDFTIVAALRADRYELAPQRDPMFAEDYPFADPVAIEDSDLSPKFGLIYRLNEATDLYVQYAHGFRAPPYEDANIGLEIPFFNYRAIPNPDLTSESSDGVDIGLRWQGLNARFHVGVFRTRYQDFIESKVRVGTDPISGRVLFQSQNLSEASIQGVEAGGSVKFAGALEGFGVDGALYYARGENKENGAGLNSVGPAQAVVGAAWTSGDGDRQLRLQATLTERWSDLDESGGELFKPEGYAVFDLYFTQHLGARVTLRAGLLNLADKTYWRWSDVRGLAPDDPVLPYLSQPGRNASVSLNVGW